MSGKIVPATATGLVAATLTALALAGPVSAFGHETDWPCAQRKVDHLSWGQMWTGPALPEQPQWRQDPALAELVPLLTARGVPIEDIRPAIAALEPTEAETHNNRLARLFAGAFGEIDDERYRIVNGITLFSEKQRALSEQIDAKRERIATLEAETAPDDFDALDALDALRDELAWDTRIYQDRQQSITYICESPVLLEKRAFEVARMIMAELTED